MIDTCTTSFSYSGRTFSFSLPSLDDHISKLLIQNQTFYELEMLEALGELLAPGETVVDAGANIGNHSVYWAGVKECRVEAYEAFPSTARILARNVAANGLEQLVRVHAIGLGDSEERVGVKSYDPTNLGGTTLEVRRDGDIPVSTLDSEPIRRPVKLLKIDVEGMELSVLRGASRILDEDRPIVACEAADDARFRSVERFMRARGYVAIGVYNATDTYIFLPCRGEAERELLVAHGFQQIMALQRGARLQSANIARAQRYVDRIKRETLNLLDAHPNKAGQDLVYLGRSLEGGGEEAAGVDDGSRWFQEYQAARRRAEIGDAAVASMERRLRDAEAEMRSLREGLQARSVAADARIASAERMLAEEIAESESREEALLEMRKLNERNKAAMQRVIRISEMERLDLQERISSLGAQLDVVKAQLQAAQEQEMKLTRMLKEAEARTADKHRRVADAHQVIAERNAQIAAVLEQYKGAEAMRIARDNELHAIRDSISFRLGREIASRMRSPWRSVALLWSLPSMFFTDYRKKRAASLVATHENSDTAGSDHD